MRGELFKAIDTWEMMVNKDKRVNQASKHDASTRDQIALVTRPYDQAGSTTIYIAVKYVVVHGGENAKKRMA